MNSKIFQDRKVRTVACILRSLIVNEWTMQHRE